MWTTSKGRIVSMTFKITPDTPGYKIFRDSNGKLFGLRDKWIIEAHDEMPLIGGYRPVGYHVLNYCNQNEYYCFSTLDYEYHGNHKYGARYQAEKKAEELNKRDNCVLAIVTGGIS